MKEETLDRVLADFPLIFFAISGGAIANYLISLGEKSIDWWHMVGIIVAVLVSLALILLVYKFLVWIAKLEL